MKLLVLGGTVFLGRHVVEAALAKGHEVTMFNRGQSNADLFPEVEKLQGDRDGNLKALEGRNWDAVIDTCGYVPRLVGDSAKLLADSVEHYSFVSSISVYPDFSNFNIDESIEVGTLEDETVEVVDGETYGPLKALCEQAAESAMPGRVNHIRAGLIVGPNDISDRFPYWVKRVAEGGEVLAPDKPENQLQVIDVRDLSEWMLHMAETRQAGTFNVTGPDRTLTMGEFLDTCKNVSGSNATFTWADEAFLMEKEVVQWVELPLWIARESAGLMTTKIDKALARGLKFRSLSDTIQVTLEWEKTRPDDLERRAGMAADREAELLEALRQIA